MNEEISIIDSNTRNEKIKNFFNNNKKPLIAILTLIILIVFSYFAYNEIQEKKNKFSRLFDMCFQFYKNPAQLSQLPGYLPLEFQFCNRGYRPYFWSRICTKFLS